MAGLPIHENLFAEIRPRPRSRFPRLARFMRNRLAFMGAVIIVILILACAIGPEVLPYDQYRISMRLRFLPPLAAGHWIGTDELGRDQLVRILAAGRISLSIGVSAMAISLVIGVLVGTIAGFYGGVLGTAIMRVVDAVLCFPTIFLLITLAALLSPSVVMITLIIAFTAWMEVARITQAQIKSLKERDFTMAAVVAGSTRWNIMLHELIPNAMAPIVVVATLIVARGILLESYVSYLGYGIQPPAASWGNMLQKSQQYLTSAPWLAIAPGLMITLAVGSFNFIGDGIRDALDPRGKA